MGRGCWRCRYSEENRQTPDMTHETQCGRGTYSEENRHTPDMTHETRCGRGPGGVSAVRKPDRDPDMTTIQCVCGKGVLVVYLQ